MTVIIRDNQSLIKSNALKRGGTQKVYRQVIYVNNRFKEYQRVLRYMDVTSTWDSRTAMRQKRLGDNRFQFFGKCRRNVDACLRS